MKQLGKVPGQVCHLFLPCNPIQDQILIGIHTGGGPSDAASRHIPLRPQWGGGGQEKQEQGVTAKPFTEEVCGRTACTGSDGDSGTGSDGDSGTGADGDSGSLRCL